MFIMSYKKHKFFVEWQAELNLLDQQKQSRRLRHLKGLDFSSNDYLSLSQHAGIRKSLSQALNPTGRKPTGRKPTGRKPTGRKPTGRVPHCLIDCDSVLTKGPASENSRTDKKNLKQGHSNILATVPLSAGGSRLLRGNTSYHEDTEKFFQKWIGKDSALLFNSGYMANIGIINILPKKAMLFSDQFNHASLIDACRLSRLPCHIYPHKDTNQLESLLKKEKNQNKVIITESLFSMGGDFAPLEELSDLSLKYQALLIVDEAHATGLYGHKGRGLCSLLKKKDHIITIHPCGKALSASGAFIAGPWTLKRYLINKCRTFIYTTAPSPLTAFHIKCVLNFLDHNPERKEKVKQKAKFFRKLLSSSLDLDHSESAIVPIVIGSSTKALAYEQFLQKKGYDIRAIRYPTVPKGQESLRICIHYNHTKEQLKKLVLYLSQKA